MADVRSIFENAFLRQKSDFFVAVGVVVVVMMLIIPLPTVFLDTLMAANLLLSLLIMLIVLYTRNALEFAIFPSMLLITTVFSLALNVSSTRLILAAGSDFDGRIVRSFASFVVGTEGTQGLVIGLIIFIIIVAVQFIVITKGATRASEVAARFTLDALPGKQMAIDQEFSSGILSEEQATRKRADLKREVDFYGAMDGATKFISGNVAVGILITLINIIGGIIVGMTIHGESFEVAINTYISLTIGDGLVSQFPALLISTASALVGTRAASEDSFGEDVARQFTRQARVYWIATVFLAVLAVLPGFPWYVLIPMAVSTAVLAYRIGKRQIAGEATEEQAADRSAAAPSTLEVSAAPLDPISLELGYGLVPLVDKDRGAELLERVTKIRRETALDLGLVVPRIRIIDNMRLEPSEYCLKIRGVEVGKGTLRLGQFLCINPGGARDEIPGEKTRDPAFGLPALWIGDEHRDRAERAGYTVVDPPSIVATHLTETIKRHASEILGRQEVKSILDNLRKDYSAVVDEVQNALSIGEVQKVLQGLLREQVSIRNMVAILECLGDFAGVTKDPHFLIEKVRQALSRQICLQYVDDDRVLRVITVDPALEQQIVASRVETTAGPVPALRPDVHRKWINALMNTVKLVQGEGHFPIVLAQEASRSLIKAGCRREIPDLVVISVPEIIADITVQGVAEVRLEQPVAVAG